MEAVRYLLDHDDHDDDRVGYGDDHDHDDNDGEGDIVLQDRSGGSFKRSIIQGTTGSTATVADCYRWDRPQ